MEEFNEKVARLLQIAKQPGRFITTAHSAEALKNLATFFTELARLKEGDAKKAA